jgi:hypothetical protein
LLGRSGVHDRRSADAANRTAIRRGLSRFCTEAECVPVSVNFRRSSRELGYATGAGSAEPKNAGSNQAGHDSPSRNGFGRRALRVVAWNIGHGAGARRPQRIASLPARSYRPDNLMPLTRRIQHRTAQAHCRAFLEQKLARYEPATQHWLVEAALQKGLWTMVFSADSGTDALGTQD